MEALAQELGILKQSVTRYVLALVVVIAFLLGCTLDSFTWSEFSIRVPLPGVPSLATQLFVSSQQALIPPQVPVVALGPVAVFMAPFLMALLVALLMTFPYALYLGVRFLWPALRSRERSLLLATLLPALGLFYLGCALAYFLIIPKTFSVLYSFAQPMGVTPFFALDQFIISVFCITLGVGLSFLFPVVMVLATRLGLVRPAFWSLHWRGALLGMLILAALITPDGSGLTMLFLFVPLAVLYGLGCWVAGYQTQPHFTDHA